MTNQINLMQIKPAGAWLTVNRACNFRCAGCYAQGTDYKSSQNMSFELACQLVELLKTINIQNLIIIGGEPTLWKHLLDFNEFCKQKKIKTTLVTNAMRFGVDSFWRKYQMFPNTSAGISVKAFDQKSLRQIASVNLFETTRKGIERGINLFKCGISVVLGLANTDKLIDLAKFAMDCGANHFKISPCTPAFCSGVPDGSFVLHPSDIVRVIVESYPKLDNITKGRLSFSIKLPLCIWPEGFIEMLVEKKQIRTVCQLHRRKGLIFDFDGKLTLCNSLFDYTLGQFGINFNDGESLLELMNSSATMATYDKLTSYPSVKCVGCVKYSVCAGGCPLFWSLYDPNNIILG